MAFTNTDLVLLSSGPNGNLIYYHDAGSDAMATVIASGYYNNTDDDINLTADDVIFADCSDGQIRMKVSAVSSGTVTTQVFDGLGSNQGDLSTASATFTYGHGEFGTGTGTAYITPTPYAGAMLTIYQSGTSTARTVAVSSTGVTFDAKGSTTLTMTGGANAFVDLKGVSTTQWVVTGISGVTAS